MTQELRQWFAAQPFFTKWIGVFSVLIPLLLKFNLISPNYLVYYWPFISRKAQIWRPISSIFIANVNLNLIFSLYFRYQYSMYLENLQFSGHPADYLWFLIMTVSLLTVFNAYFGLAVLWQAFSMAIVHLWAQYNKAVTVNFMFGFRFPAVYLPAAMLAYDFVTTGSGIGTIMGIVVGHIYYFGKEVMGRKNPRILKYFEAPRFLRRLVTVSRMPKPGETVTKSAGYTVHAPINPIKKPVEEEKPQFKPFSGSAKKLGSD